MWKKKLKEFKLDREDMGSSTLKDILNRVVPKSGMLKNNRAYMVLLVFIALIYINNNFKVESMLKEHLNLTREVKDLKYEAITTSSELTKISRQSEVVKKVQEKNLGLEVLTTPPKTIIVK